MSLLSTWKSLHEPDPDGWYLLGDEMRAKHPGIELFASHPELGLVEQDEGLLWLPSRAQLGMRWLALSEEEQRLRLRDLLRAILEWAAAGDQPRFRVDDGECGPWTRQLAALPGAASEPAELIEGDLSFVEGELTPAAIALLAELPDGVALRVKRDGRLWCEVPDGEPGRPRPGFGLWLDPWHTGELEQALSKAWWEAAEQRRSAAEGCRLPVARDGGRVSRETRGQVLVGWDRAGRWAAPVAAVALYPLLPLPFALAALVMIVAVLAVLRTVGSVLEHWYERS